MNGWEFFKTVFMYPIIILKIKNYFKFHAIWPLRRNNTQWMVMIMSGNICLPFHVWVSGGLTFKKNICSSVRFYLTTWHWEGIQIRVPATTYCSQSYFFSIIACLTCKCNSSPYFPIKFLGWNNLISKGCKVYCDKISHLYSFGSLDHKHSTKVFSKNPDFEGLIMKNNLRKPTIQIKGQNHLC